MPRKILWLAGGTATACLAGYLLRETQGLIDNDILHINLEYVSLTMGFIISYFAFLRFLRFGERAWLYLGLSFIASVAINAVHVFTFTYFEGDTAIALLRPENYWSWLLAGTVLPMFLYLSRFLPQGFSPEPRIYILLTSLGAVVFTVWFINLLTMDLPLPYFPEEGNPLINRPMDLLPLLLYILTACHYAEKTGALDKRIALGLGIHAGAHSLILFSFIHYDYPFLLAHIFKIIAPFFILSGILEEHMNLYLGAKKAASLHAKSQFILDAIDAGVVAVNQNGIIDTLNPAAERIFSLRREEALGRPFREVFNIPRNKCHHVLHALEKGVEYRDSPVNNHCSCCCLPPHLRVDSHLLRDHKGQIIGAVSLYRDLTEQRRLEDEIARSEKLRLVGQLAAGIAHEIRNPMTTIRGFLQLLSQRPGLPPSDLEYFEIMIDELDRAHKIIRDFLSLARPHVDSTSWEDLTQIIRDLSLILETQALLQDIVMEKNLEPVPKVKIEKEQIKQVLLNLIHNAMDAMPQGGKIVVTTGYSPQEGTVFCSIRDTGHGIPEADQARLGDPFFTTKDTGTGLGLTICYRIIENHGGSIRVESKPGEGTVFTITLPAGQEAEAGLGA